MSNKYEERNSFPNGETITHDKRYTDKRNSKDGTK